jgi:hypothetical protein
MIYDAARRHSRSTSTSLSHRRTRPKRLELHFSCPLRMMWAAPPPASECHEWCFFAKARIVRRSQ